MPTPTDQILTALDQLIARGASLYFFDGSDSIPLKCAAWIPGKGLLIAEAAAIDQSGVHLIEATDLEHDDAPEFDLIQGSGPLTAGGLYASIAPDERTPLPVLPEGWAAFWADEIQNAKGGE